MSARPACQRCGSPAEHMEGNPDRRDGSLLVYLVCDRRGGVRLRSGGRARAWRAVMATVTFRCSCGSSAKATTKPDAEAEQIMALFRAGHLGDGHSEVDAAEFARIRARQRRAEA